MVVIRVFRTRFQSGVHNFRTRGELIEMVLHFNRSLVYANNLSKAYCAWRTSKSEKWSLGSTPIDFREFSVEIEAVSPN
jgi:hypothetical protein